MSQRVALLYLASSLLLAAAQPSVAQNLSITNARIIDGTGRVIERGTIVVRDGRIESVTADGGAEAGTPTVDASGMTVMPAFIDAHRHVIEGDPQAWLDTQAADRMREFLEAGFTTVLSAGDPVDQILELRRRLDAGELDGPRLIAAGMVPLAGGGGFPAGTDPARLRPPPPTEPAPAIPAEQTRATVASLAAAGVDAIKTVINVTPGGPEQATLTAIVEQAEELGLPVITHAVSVQDTIAAVEADVSTLVHTPHIGLLDAPTARMIADAGIPMISTLGVFVPTFAEDNERIRERYGAADNVPRFRDLEPFPFVTLSSAGLGPVNARLLWEAGITYGFGTDTTFRPRDSLEHELRALRLVFSARDIVEILTRNAAAAAGRGDDLGTLEPGKLADIVLVDGDPLADIYDVLDVELVVKGGEILVDERQRDAARTARANADPAAALERARAELARARTSLETAARALASLSADAL